MIDHQQYASEKLKLILNWSQNGVKIMIENIPFILFAAIASFMYEKQLFNKKIIVFLNFTKFILRISLSMKCLDESNSKPLCLNLG